MRILERYVTRTVLQSTGLVTLVIFGLLFFVNLVARLDTLGKGSMTFSILLRTTLLQMPQDFYQLFPMVCLLGCLLGLGSLATHYELVIVRVSGVALPRLAAWVLKGMLPVVLLMVLVGELFAPWAGHHADQLRMLAKSGGRILQTQRGLWVRDANSFMHIERVMENGDLHDVVRFEFDDKMRLQKASQAKRLHYAQGRWWAEAVSTSYFKPRSVSSVKAEKKQWQFALTPKMLGFGWRQASDMTLKQLHAYIHYRQHNHLMYNSLKLQFWQRLWWPFSTLVAVFLALPCVFGPLRGASMGLRTVMGVVIGMAFYLLNHFMGSLSLIYQISPLIAAPLPSLLCLILAFWILRSTNH